MIIRTLSFVALLLFDGALVEGVTSGRYEWKTPPAARGLATTSIFQGSAHDFEYMAMESCRISSASGQVSAKVPPDEEHLLIIRSGNLLLSFSDSTWSLGHGSIAVLIPGERTSLKCETGDCDFYRMRYRAREKEHPLRTGTSFVRQWEKLRFRTHDRGGVRSYFDQATVMSKRFEMHATTLNPGLKSHEPHTHRAEEIILMMQDTGSGAAKTEMLIGEQLYSGGAGDLFYVRSNELHGIRNTGDTPCTYFAFQFE